MKKISFSYASKSEHNFAQRLIIKMIEELTGKRKLEKLYKNYSLDKRNPQNFWSDILSEMKIEVVNKSNNKEFIPTTGSLLIIANHPFGIIDGLILCSLVSKVRSDFKIMTHETLQFLSELEQFILPVNFSKKNKESKKSNINSAIRAREQLDNNGVVIIFPSGRVSTAKNIKSEAIDDEWKLFPAKLIHQTKTDVLPIYFDGKNGLMFHIFSSKIKNQTLKYSTYMHETRKKIGKKINIHFGKIITYNEINTFGNRIELMNYLKNETYKLKNDIKHNE